MTIREINFKFLSGLQGDEFLSVDKQGRIIQVQEASKAGQIAKEILQSEGFKDAQNVAYEFIFKELDKPQDLLEDRELFNDRLFQFSEIGLINANQKKEILRKQQEKRLKDLGHYDPEVASAIVALECAYNGNYSAEEIKKYTPELIKMGFSGSYFLKNLKGDVVGVFKPQYQERWMPLNPKGKKDSFDPNKPKETQRNGHLQGTSWLNEVAAYELSDPLIGVPKTVKITVPLIADDGKMYLQQGSFQKFVQGKPLIELKGQLHSIPDKEIQKVAVFDMLMMNGDRHYGNALFDGKNVIPIDHGLCFLREPFIHGPWLVLPQINKKLDDDVRKWILNFDIDKSMKKLESLSIDRQSIIMHKTMFLYLVNRIKKGEDLNKIVDRCMIKKGSYTSELATIIISVNLQASQSDKNFEDEYFRFFQLELDKL